jgi:hypothetical protein
VVAAVDLVGFGQIEEAALHSGVWAAIWRLWGSQGR